MPKSPRKKPRKKRTNTFAVPSSINGKVAISRGRTALKIGVHLQTTYRLQATDPDFPQPVQISANRVVFIEEEIDHWLATRPRVPPPTYVDSRPGRQRLASPPEPKKRQPSAQSSPRQSERAGACIKTNPPRQRQLSERV